MKGLFPVLPVFVGECLPWALIILPGGGSQAQGGFGSKPWVPSPALPSSPGGGAEGKAEGARVWPQGPSLLMLQTCPHLLQAHALWP